MIRGIGTQTWRVIDDNDPAQGFDLLKETGFDCCDFSLNRYLLNTDLYNKRRSRFFEKSEEELREYFRPHKEGAEAAGIKIHQMHMPYPIYIPGNTKEINDHLWNEVAPKSMEICAFLECPFIVIHGLKLRKQLGSEAAEWERTEEFLDSILPIAKEKGIVVCMENLYDGQAGHMIDGPCTDPYITAERIDRINERYGGEVLGFCFDTGHANLLSLDFGRYMGVMGKRIRVLHIHDNDGRADLHQLPYTFTRTRENEPSTDWDGFLRALSDIDFDGVLSFETAPVLSAFPEGMKADALRLIAATGRYFRDRVSEKPSL
jgi:sugar phosphate isomerase/epimerase